MKIVPFFVADRPMSLRLLKGLPLEKYPDVRIGIMAHANTTLNFQKAYHDYPCDDFDYCDAVGGPCQFKHNLDLCPTRRHILGHTVKMCDSGIFTREGAMLNYNQLFEAYVRMGVEYGIIIDVFRDPQATLKSAQEALIAYEPFKDQFKLVGVAQGITPEEYIQNYEDLKALGFSYVAIGGLLRKLENTARYTKVRSEEVMYTVLETLRDKYPDDWLFALGCFHPNRLEKFKKLNVWGDYKGWIFKYEKRNTTLNTQLEKFASNHLEHIDVEGRHEVTQLISALKQQVQCRNTLVADQKNLSRQFFEGRRAVKTSLSSLYQKLQTIDPGAADRIKNWTSRGLLSEGEEKQIIEILQKTRLTEIEEVHQLFDIIRRNRELKSQIADLEVQLNGMNISLTEGVAKLSSEGLEITEDTTEFFDELAGLVENTEREHRFVQVRNKIDRNILTLL
jgi:DNA-binding Lrp family transcriptional regulator